MGCSSIQAAQRMLSPLFYPGLQQWYMAERVNGSDAIDLSGNGRTGTNVAGVAIVPGVANGRPVFRFNGIGSFLSYTAFASTTNFSCFAYLKNTTIVTARSMQCWANVAVNTQILAGNATNRLACFDNVVNPMTTNPVDDYTAFSLCGVVCTAGSCEFFQNNVSLGVGVGAFASRNINVFGQVLSVVFATMDVAEMVFYTAALTSVQRTVLNEYFRQRYNF